jgi:hypothetical protein
MKVKVTAELTIGYGGAYHAPGSEFEIEAKDLPQIGALVAVIDAQDLDAAQGHPEGEPDGAELTYIPELTIAQLKATLDDLGIEYPKRAKRDELIALLPE